MQTKYRLNPVNLVAPVRERGLKFEEEDDA